jgi:hypothetical protein
MDIGWGGDDDDTKCWRFLIHPHSARLQGTAHGLRIAARWVAGDAMICVEPSLSFQTRSGPRYRKKRCGCWSGAKRPALTRTLQPPAWNLFSAHTHNPRRLPAWSRCHMTRVPRIGPVSKHSKTTRGSQADYCTFGRRDDRVRLA